MAVTACNLINVKATESKEGFTTYTQKWQVLTDSRTDGPKTVKEHPDLPKRGDNYSIPGGEEAEFAAFVDRSIDLAADEDTLKKWFVTVNFSDDPGKGSKNDPSQPPGDPVDEPPTIQTYAIKGKQAILYDLDGQMIASSAGEPYDPVQERDDTSYMLRISRNQDSVDPAFYALYRDAVNSDMFFGCEPETVKVETPGAIEVLYGGGRKYYRVTWEFSLKSGEVEVLGNKDNWRLWIVDYGMYALVGDAPNKKLVALRDLEGRALTAPRLLNNGGAVNPVGDPPQIRLLTAGGYKIYRPLPFSALGLPNTF